MHKTITKSSLTRRIMKQELNSSYELIPTSEPQTSRGNPYGSPDGLDATIQAAEAKRISTFGERNNNKRRLIGKEERRSKLPIVDLSTFKEHSELMERYSDLAIASEYKAELGETGFLVEGDENITAEMIERGCKLAVAKVQSQYKHLMHTIKRDGAPFLPNLVYFRLTPAKKVFMSFNISQLKLIAHRRVMTQTLVVDKDCSDFMEKFNQLCAHMTSEESDLVDAHCEIVRSAIFNTFESQCFVIHFKKAVDEDYSILRILQPYDKMEDWLDPLLWKLTSGEVGVLAKTPIFNEGIARNGIEFHSALILISISNKYKKQFPLKSDSFPQTEIDVLAFSFRCQDCVTERNSKPCPHCKVCTCSRWYNNCGGTCIHGKVYRLVVNEKVR